MRLCGTRRELCRIVLLSSFVLGLWCYDIAFLRQQQRPSFAIKFSSNKKRKRLPSFSDRGGVVLFWHVVKTGGVTVRKSFYEFQKLNKNIVVERSWVKRDYGKVANQVYDYYLKPSNPNEILLWELHGPDVPGIVDMKRDLRKWKSLARKHNKAFFSFTLLREPVSLAVSYYNFFHVVPKRNVYFNETNDARIKRQEAELLNITIPNRQCTALSGRGGMGTHIRPPLPAAEETRSCQATFTTLDQEFDWIGVTSRLTNETLPLLTKMLFDNASLADTLQSYNVLDTGQSMLKTNDLKPSTIEWIRSISNHDLEMWRRVQRDYTSNMWDDSS